jgi:nitroreductase/NAD-dependent dihydropyrimidine dehydrogenase PreA subunit
MPIFKVERDKCRQEGICAAECPSRIIQLNADDGYPEPTAEANRFCLACGHCVAVCPHGALSLKWLNPDDCPPVQTEPALPPEQAERFLRSRRSIRCFEDRKVERKKLEKLIGIGCYAPSARNRQPWHWLVVEDPAGVRRLAAMVIDWMRGLISSNPAAAEESGFVRLVEAWDSGYDRICREAPHVVIAHAHKNWPFGLVDCTLALEYLDLYAPVLGLGTCWAGYLYTAINQYSPLFEMLGLPPDHRVRGAMMIGYPKFRYQRLPLRKRPRIVWR